MELAEPQVETFHRDFTPIGMLPDDCLRELAQAAAAG
jgi:hypothetical protein